MRHMDGNQPSGFTDSTYIGMNPPVKTITPTSTPVEEPVVIKSFLDLILKSPTPEQFWENFG